MTWKDLIGTEEKRKISSKNNKITVILADIFDLKEEKQILNFSSLVFVKRQL